MGAVQRETDTGSRDAASGGCPFISARAAEFDPFSDGYQQDPPAYVAWSREEAPVFYSPKLDYWVVTRYEDIKAIFRDNETFSPSVALEKITPTSDEANAVLASYDYGMKRTLVNEDEPQHMARRRALMGPFDVEHLAHHEAMVRRLTRQYVDAFVDEGRADLVDQMFWEIPLTVALDFLGVPDEDKPTLRRYSIAHTVNTWGRPKPEDQVAVAHAVGKFWQYSGQVLEHMRRHPDEEGWMQYAVRKQRDAPDVVTDSYLHSMMMAVIVAAHETTANASANAVKLLLENRHTWERLCQDPALIPNAVEECLRHNGSQAAWRRITTSDTTVGGVEIPEGSRILMVSASGNHDPRRFEDPHLVDIHRDESNEHLTFGYGAHQCLGKNLARMEMQVFLEELTRRLPHMRLAEQEFTYVPNTSFRGPEHLWVEWDPALNPERVDPNVLDPQLTVNIGEPTEEHRTRPMRVDRVTDAADGVRHIRMSSADGTPLPRFTPGAHVSVVCGDTGLVRQYSLCGPSDAGATTGGCPVSGGRPQYYEIAVLKEEESRGGSAWIHQNVGEGDTLAVRGPRNHFRLPETPARLLLVAGGIGITPIRTMADWARRNDVPYELHYLGRRRDSMAFLEELTHTHGDNLRIHCAGDGERADLTHLLTSVDAEAKAGALHVYACGPQRMIDTLDEASADWPEGAMVFEHFASTVGGLDPEKERDFSLVLEDSAREVRVPRDKTVLRALRDAGYPIPSNCEEGLCGTCEIPVLDGEIDHRDVVLTPAERRRGDRMMACCSRSVNDRIVLGL
ncbi:cytochrome P450/oxidoreductase [Spiractinospora alimapuensis]|uniref:cytochrome P450/oxidoreductase n=1 Tax=Spiractinospora alimapuensis TaxID=2820884 RepID=UPI001F46CC72|nr:cytochrome P450/oxidoreductase [Spiractinospora alimapuensis]QVQ51864.1 cytochrome P450/oxidoreductase [Spiractinospora alimapuensis]